VRRWYQFHIVLLSIALQASDLLVGGFGHRHEHPTGVASSCDDCDHHGCGHDHGAAAAGQHHEEQAPTDHDDDCSLCRHFSQPVAPVAIKVPVVACERVTPLFVRLVRIVGVRADICHPARGPPASIA